MKHVMNNAVSIHLDEHVLRHGLGDGGGDVPERGVGDEGLVSVEDWLWRVILELRRFIRSVRVWLGGGLIVCWWLVLVVVIVIIIISVVSIVIIVIVVVSV